MTAATRGTSAKARRAVRKAPPPAAVCIAAPTRCSCPIVLAASRSRPFCHTRGRDCHSSRSITRCAIGDRCDAGGGRCGGCGRSPTWRAPSLGHARLSCTGWPAGCGENANGPPAAGRRRATVAYRAGRRSAPGAAGGVIGVLAPRDRRRRRTPSDRAGAGGSAAAGRAVRHRWPAGLPLPGRRRAGGPAWNVASRSLRARPGTRAPARSTAEGSTAGGDTADARPSGAAHQHVAAAQCDHTGVRQVGVHPVVSGQHRAAAPDGAVRGAGRRRCLTGSHRRAGGGQPGPAVGAYPAQRRLRGGLQSRREPGPRGLSAVSQQRHRGALWRLRRVGCRGRLGRQDRPGRRPAGVSGRAATGKRRHHLG